MSRKFKVSHYQRPMLSLDENGKVTYFISGFPQTLEELEDYNINFEDVALEESDVSLLGFNTKTPNESDISKVEKEDNRTVQLSISDLEKVRKIITAIPQFRNLAIEEEQNIESLEFLAQAVSSVDFLSLPHFDIDMSIFNLLPRNNPEYREFVFNSILTLINNVSKFNKLPSKMYLSKIFIDFTPSEIDMAYQIIKRLLSMLNAWGGIQIHFFEQTIRDWLYLVYENGMSMNQSQIYEYLKQKYTCKPDYELFYLAEMLWNATSNETSLDKFVDEFITFLHYFIPEQNSFLNSDETFRLWISDYLQNRVKKAATKWRQRMSVSEVDTPNDDLEAFFGAKDRLTKLRLEEQLPAEICATQSTNEMVVKLKLYFPDGYRTLVETRIDRMTIDENGNVRIYDWKTSKKQLSEMNDFEKLQIILQTIALQSLMKRPIGSPMVNGDYKFFIVSESLEWIDVSMLPKFFHIPENTDLTYDYVQLDIPPDEVQRLLNSFSKIVNFLICNKKQIAKVRRNLKNMDQYIPAPKLASPEFLTVEA